MDEFLDMLWSKIVTGVDYVFDVVSRMLMPLEVMGPMPVIILLVAITVLMTKFLNRIYTTRRYETLKKEFTHWHSLRQEALACEDREKGKLLARNIDQGELNKVYYDFFFEGLLKNILTTYLPCLIVAAYVNEAYKPDKLMAKFGKDHVFQIGASNGDPTLIGGLFCYVALLLTTYLVWFIVAKTMGRPKNQKKDKTAPGDDAGSE